MEFYDEELSRTIRQVQALLLEFQQQGRVTQEEQRIKLQPLMRSCDAYLAQLQAETGRLKSKQERKEWKELVHFRRAAVSQLKEQVSQQQQQQG